MERWISTEEAMLRRWQKPAGYKGYYMPLDEWLLAVKVRFARYPQANIAHHVTTYCTSRVTWLMPNGLEAIYYLQVRNDARHPITFWGGCRLGNAYAVVECGTQRQRGAQGTDWLAKLAPQHELRGSMLKQVVPYSVPPAQVYWPLYRVLPRRMFDGAGIDGGTPTVTLGAVLEDVWRGTEKFSPHAQPANLATAWGIVTGLRWPLKIAVANG